MTEMKQVLDFWFGPLENEGDFPEDRSAIWFKKSQAIDDEIRRRFQTLLREIKAGQHADWAVTASGRLALIVVLDQFSRNIYRDLPQSFQQDAQALAFCLEGLDLSQDLELKPVERVFFYLPLEHSESLAHQDLCVAKVRTLARDAPPELSRYLSSTLEWAEKHRDIIRRFGRYPHRNRILGRTSTAEERAFLQTPGSSF